MRASRHLIVSVIVMGLLLSAAIASAQLVDKKSLTLDAAKKVAAAAEEEASKNKWTVVIAIVDDGSNLVYVQRLDETQIGSIEVAIQKAKTSASFKRPTKALEDAVMTGGRTVVLSLPGALPIEGGLPIVVDGKMIGAIGVSGVTAQQDAQIAKAGVDALAKALGR
jgi:glc operon protein GlcG